MAANASLCIRYWIYNHPGSSRNPILREPQKKRVFYKDIGDGVPDKEANTKKVDDESTKLEPKWLRDPKGYGVRGSAGPAGENAARCISKPLYIQVYRENIESIYRPYWNLWFLIVQFVSRDSPCNCKIVQ